MNFFSELLINMEPINEYEILNTILKIKQGLTEYYIEFGPNNNILPIHNNIFSDHLIRLLIMRGIKNISSKNTFELFTIFDTIDLLSSCTICGLSINSYGKISCCTNTDCVAKFTELVTDNIILDFYVRDKITFNLLVLTAYACLKHPQREEIFKPFPPNFKSFEDLGKKLKYDYSNIKTLFDIVSNILSDYELLETIGTNDYAFLKFIIGSNITNMRSDLLFSKNKNIFDQINLENIFDHSDIISFRVDQDPLTNKRFEGVEQNYLFSGSCLSNWYSILRNGMKVYSGTKMQTHGAAYGPGIYLSDTLATSLNYGADKYCSSGLYVYGVFQVLGNKKTYYKSNTIFVVPNESELVLRHLIVMNSKNQHMIPKINDYFMVQKQKEVMTGTINYNSVRIKRIIYDVSKITKICKKEDWVVTHNMENINRVEIVKNKVCICVMYSDDYPSEPPHIWVANTDKKINSSDILNCGAIMNRKLSYKFWETSTEIHKIIKCILKSVSDELIPYKTYDEKSSLIEAIGIGKGMF